MASRSPLNLVCRRVSLDSILEGHFIRDILLGGIERPLRIFALEADQAVPYFNDALFLSVGEEFADHLREARRRGARNIGLFHIGDEAGTHDRGFYAHADFVIRHYWFEHAFASPGPASLGVIWVPNGYRTGVGPIAAATMLDTANRTCPGFFAGAIRGRTLSEEREEMVRVVSAAKLPFVLLETPGFAGGLGPVSYAAWLGSARFALIPGGNAAETVRLYDALEAGAVPIMLKSPFVTAADALDNPPFPLLDSWQQLPAFYARFSQSQSPDTVAALERLRQTIVVWWNAFKAAQQGKVKALIDRAFAAYWAQ